MNSSVRLRYKATRAVCQHEIDAASVQPRRHSGVMTPSLALIDGTKVTRSGFKSLPQTVSGAVQEKKKEKKEKRPHFNY